MIARTGPECKAWRKLSGVTQAQVAVVLGVTRVAVSNLERLAVVPDDAFWRYAQAVDECKRRLLPDRIPSTVQVFDMAGGRRWPDV